MTDSVKLTPLPPVFVTYFSATLNNGIGALALYAQAHDEIGESPKPMCAASLVFRAANLRAMAGIIGDLLGKAGWTDPAASQPSPRSPPPSGAAPAPAPPLPVKPVAPVFVSNLSSTFIDGMVIVTFFAHSETGIGLPATLIPVFTAAIRAGEAKALASMIEDLFLKGEMMGKLKDAPTTGVQ